jgi:hypothetical protein
MEDASKVKVSSINRSLQIPAETFHAIKQKAENENRSFNFIAVRLLKLALDGLKKEDTQV